MKHEWRLIILAVFLGLVACKQKETTTTPVTPTQVPVTVDIKVAGLCTFADASVVGETARKTILLAKQPGHDAAFVVHRNNLVDTTGFIRLKDKDGNPGDYWAFPLDGLQIELSADKDNYDGAMPLAFSTDGDGNNAVFPTIGQGSNTDSVHWIPSMTRILGFTPSPKNTFVKKEPSKNDVLARIPLRGGSLQSILKSPYWLWMFRTNAGDYKQVQVLADEIHHMFPLKQGMMKFTVYGRPFVKSGTPSHPTPLFTVKTASVSETEIPIALVNLPLALASNDPGPYPPISSPLKLGYKDPHFHLHYATLDKGPTQYEPLVIGRMESGPGPLSVEVYCGPDGLP
jgi:hypothetical protein